MNLSENNLQNIGERRPRGNAWAQNLYVNPDELPDTYAISIWTRGRYRVVSELCVTEMPSGRVGPQWSVSISRKGKRVANGEECRRVLRAFGMVGSDERDRGVGRVRKFCLPLDESELWIVGGAVSGQRI